MNRGEEGSRKAKKGLNELKRDIALNQYDVDAGVVADAILNKLRLVKRGRLALEASAADRTLTGSARRRRVA